MLRFGQYFSPEEAKLGTFSKPQKEKSRGAQEGKDEWASGRGTQQVDLGPQNHEGGPCACSPRQWTGSQGGAAPGRMQRARLEAEDTPMEKGRI